MKKILLSFCLVFLCFITSAQLPDVIDNLIKSTPKDVKEPNALTTSKDSALRADSILIEDLKQQIQEMKMKELMENTELGKNAIADSINQLKRRAQIDSLRATNKGVPVVIDKDTLFWFYTKIGGLSVTDRANRTTNRIIEMGATRSLKPDSIHISETDGILELISNGTIVLTVSANDAMWMNAPQDSLAMLYRQKVVDKVIELQKENSIMQLVIRILKFIGIIILQILLFKLTAYIFLKIRRLIVRAAHNKKLKPISFNGYEFLNTIRQARMLAFFAGIIRYSLVLLQLVFSVPMLFALFPQTEALAAKLFGYIYSPFKSILNQFVNYLPNLFTIIVIWACVFYILRGLRYIAKEVEAERLNIPGFYPDWAMSSFNIVRFLMYAFMLAMIYPHLPGSGSSAVQGISVFVGLIVSLGSSTVIANIMAGMIITYMRPFKMGDRIKLKDIIGNVIEKTPFVTRLKTPKNEVITIPNSDIMSAHITNYSESARSFGLILHTTITFGYAVHWTLVHKLLIEAALDTDGVMDSPTPFVLETGLADLYPLYQINVYIQDANRMAGIYSELHQNIQNRFKAEGLDMECPAAYVRRDNN